MDIELTGFGTSNRMPSGKCGERALHTLVWNFEFFTGRLNWQLSFFVQMDLFFDFLTRGSGFLKKNFVVWVKDINFRLRNFRLCFKHLNFVWGWLKRTCNLAIGNRLPIFLRRPQQATPDWEPWTYRFVDLWCTRFTLRNIGEEIAEIATSIFVLFRTRLNALFTWRRFFLLLTYVEWRAWLLFEVSNFSWKAL